MALTFCESKDMSAYADSYIIPVFPEKSRFFRLFFPIAPVIIKCTETHMSRLCIFLFISTP